MALSRRLVAEEIAGRLLGGESAQTVMRSLAAYLIEHKLIKQADHFVSDIERVLAEQQTVIADVTTVRQLDESLRTAIIRAINAIHVELREHIDADLIGGVIIKTPTQELDASVRTKLRRLRTT